MKVRLGFIIVLFFLVLLPVSAFASSASAGSKTSSVNVSILENRTDRTVIHYEFGDFSQQQVTIKNHTYNAIFLKGESNKKEVGKPALPDVSRSIIIADDALVEINVLDSEYYEIEDFDIVPSKGYISREISPTDIPYTFGNTYEYDAFYPGPLAQLGKPYIMRDHRGIVVTVNPFQYNPVRRLLRVYTQMTVEVTAAGLDKINVLQRDVRKRKLNRAFKTIYSAHFINISQAERYTAMDEEGELLIIVHDDWNSNVQPLKVHKENIGITTTIQNVSAIPGGNSHTAIKAYIQGIYDDTTRELAYVLLVGDLAHVDSFTAVTGKDGESDPKYSKLAGSDDYPDIIVGRLSAETADDVDTQVERIIEYETMPARSQNWFWQGTGIASDDGSGNGDDSEWDWEHMRYIRTDLLNYGYTQIDELYEGDQGGGDAAGNPTDTMVSTSVNTGRGIINYCGHGGTTNWSTTGFNNTDVNALTNDNMLPFIFDVACLNGNFGEQTCFAEAWMRAKNGTEPTGAIGIYASSINQPWSPPMEAQDEFNLLYVADSYNAYGAYCYAAACSMMDDYPGDGETYGNGHATFNTWHIFGDPTLRITGQSVGTEWYFGPSLSYARHGLDVVAHNGKIYAIGGWNGDDKLEVLDTGSGAWVELQSLPTGQAGVAAALVGNKIYTMGDYGAHNTCQIYDINTDTWQSGPDIPIGLYWATAEAVGDKIYLIGGYSGGPGLDTLYILDTISNTWSQGSNMPSGIQIPASAVYDNQIYVFASGFYYKYNIGTDTWASFPAPPSGHGYASEAVTVGDKIYLIGGNLGYIYEAYTTVEIYDTVSQTWEVGPELNVGRYQFGGAYASGKIYAIGGRDEYAQSLSSVEILEPEVEPSEFVDVPPGHWAEEAIYKIYDVGITQGCSQSPLKFCPDVVTNREQMAVFLGRGVHGSEFTPPDATGIFDDVALDHWAADWIEQAYNDGITKGCSTNPLRYCPTVTVTRAQMAVFLLRAKHEGSYTPPDATGIFSDVDLEHWAADWIEQLYNEGITVGCGTDPLRYCPDSSVTRAQMAVFLMRTFGL